MDEEAFDIAAIAETVVFLSYFNDLPDDRQIAKVKYPLPEVLLLCLLAVIAGAETITDIARFGEKKLALLRWFRRSSSIRKPTASSPSKAIRAPCAMMSTLRHRTKIQVFRDTTVSRHRTVDGDHGRIETRDITVIHDVEWLQKDHRWPALNSVVMVESARQTGNRIERETCFYITSLLLVASLVGPLVRDHWAVENSLHWVLDIVFRDDECRLRTDHAPANFTTLKHRALKHRALNLIIKAPGKDSVRLKRKVAAWDDGFLASLITR